MSISARITFDIKESLVESAKAAGFALEEWQIEEAGYKAARNFVNHLHRIMKNNLDVVKGVESADTKTDRAKAKPENVPQRRKSA